MFVQKDGRCRINDCQALDDTEDQEDPSPGLGLGMAGQVQYYTVVGWCSVDWGGVVEWCAENVSGPGLVPVPGPIPVPDPVIFGPVDWSRFR